MSDSAKQDAYLMSLIRKAISDHGRAQSTMGVPRRDLRIGDYLIRAWSDPDITVFLILVPDGPRSGENLTALYTRHLGWIDAGSHRRPLLELLRRMMILEELADV